MRQSKQAVFCWAFQLIVQMHNHVRQNKENKNCGYRTALWPPWGKAGQLLITPSSRQTFKRNEDSAVCSWEVKTVHSIKVFCFCLFYSILFFKRCESLRPLEVLQPSAMKVPENIRLKGPVLCKTDWRKNASMHTNKTHELPLGICLAEIITN